MKQRRLARTPHRFGLLPFRSPLLRESSLFLEVLRCFSSPGSPRHPFGARSSGITLRGLPHSEISGSPVASTSPERFAAWLRPSSAAGAKASTVCPSSRTFPRATSRLRPPRGPFPAHSSFVITTCVVLAFSAVFFRVCAVRRRRISRPRRTPALFCADTRACARRVCRSPRRQVAPLPHLSMCRQRDSLLRLNRSFALLARWSRGDSNPGPPPCKGGALPAKLRPRAGGRAWTRTRDLGLIRAAL